MSDEMHSEFVSLANQQMKPAIDLIKEFEGCRLQAYRDPVGVATIGWGTTVYPDGHRVKMGDHCTSDQAEEYLLNDLMDFSASVGSLVKVKISNNAHCALTSFCYNLGAGALAKSTLLKKLNAKAPMVSVAAEFGKWVNAGGKPLKGLIRRRAAEKALFLS